MPWRAEQIRFIYHGSMKTMRLRRSSAIGSASYSASNLEDLRFRWATFRRTAQVALHMPPTYCESLSARQSLQRIEVLRLPETCHTVDPIRWQQAPLSTCSRRSSAL